MTSCCNGEGDTKRMCFTRIGDLTKMSADDILKVRACKHTPYAIAYWVYNNHYDDLQVNPEFWLKDKYIQLITQGDTSMEGDIDDAIADMDWDAHYDKDGKLRAGKQRWWWG